MAKRKPARAKAAKAAAKKSTRRTAGRAMTRRAKAKATSRSAKRPTAKKKSTRKRARKATRQVVARQAAARKVAKGTKRVKRVASKAKAVHRSATPRRAVEGSGIGVRAKAKTVTASSKAAIQTALPLPAAVAPKAARTPAPRPKRAPTLDRARKTVGEPEPHGLPSSLDVDRTPSAARSGRKELGDKIREHTSTSPSITAGDVDADWEAAESVGDEAPGGDNPTPDQDVVDDIGRALGVEYDDDEELKGGDEIAARDRHRWELDPSSSDDYEDRD